MKAILAIAVLFSSLTASANTFRSTCDFSDYQEINAALETLEVRSGAELKATVEAMLMQEMGPKCEQVMVFGEATIPGDKFKDFEIRSGSEAFRVTLASSIEQGKSWVTIEAIP